MDPLPTLNIKVTNLDDHKVIYVNLCLTLFGIMTSLARQRFFMPYRIMTIRHANKVTVEMIINLV